MHGCYVQISYLPFIMPMTRGFSFLYSLRVTPTFSSVLLFPWCWSCLSGKFQRIFHQWPLALLTDWKGWILFGEQYQFKTKYWILKVELSVEEWTLANIVMVCRPCILHCVLTWNWLLSLCTLFTFLIIVLVFTFINPLM